MGFLATGRIDCHPAAQGKRNFIALCKMRNAQEYFAELLDLRVERTRRHMLQEIIFMSIAAILSGAGD